MIKFIYVTVGAILHALTVLAFGFVGALIIYLALMVIVAITRISINLPFLSELKKDAKDPVYEIYEDWRFKIVKHEIGYYNDPTHFLIHPILYIFKYKTLIPHEFTVIVDEVPDKKLSEVWESEYDKKISWNEWISGKDIKIINLNKEYLNSFK